MPEQDFIIDVHHLFKNFDGKPVIRDISLKVARGKICGFLGPNGAGKTTIMRILCGLLTPDSGSGTCVGYDILKETKKIKQNIGYVSQFFGLYGQLTVYENIMFMTELYGVSNKKNKVKLIMEQLNLTPWRNHLAGTLSGGWKQRLSLAAALTHDPSLLILDEPTANVDPKSRHNFWDLMHNLSEKEMTILLSSHNMNEVEHCHEIAYICDGTLLLNSSRAEISKNVGLTTWKATGPRLNLLAKRLKETPGIDQAVTFLDTLHVTSQDKIKLEKAISPYVNETDFQWEEIDSTLEDIFIWLSEKKLNS